jgi:site-specific DNA-methyltransferase (adenine-specific)
VVLSPNRVHAGDCLERLSQLSPGSIDLVFADPPFNIGYEYDVYDDRRSAEEYLAWSRKWMKGVHRALKDNGTFWLAIGDEFAAELKVAAQYDVGFHCRSWVIWYYTFGVNCVRGFSRSHTHLFHFVKNPRDFVFNESNPQVRVASARALVYADKRANPKGRLPDDTWILRPQDAPCGFAPNHDSWYFARIAGTFHERQGFHGCQMPEQLLGRIIRISSNPRDTVLDPFSGSGTTLAVAKKLGRQWIGFELSKDYVKRIQERLDAVSPGDELTGPVNPLASSPSTARGKRKKGVRLYNGRPIPFADEDMQRGIAAAFKSSAQGYSADYVLCEPDLRKEFLRECKRLGLNGAEHVWNRVLLRLRKAGKLPKATRKQKRYTFAEMDSYSFASEIAIRLLEMDYGLKLDDILCHADAVHEFDEIAREFAPNHSTFEYRWAALAIRKRARKSKALAINKYSNWEKRRLPPAQLITDIRADRVRRPGVYVLENKLRNPLYVGESRNVYERIEAITEHESWSSLGVNKLRFLPGDEETLHGLQSILVYRERPLLNTQLLLPEAKEVEALQR